MHQWVKNVLVFIPLIASHSFTPHLIYQSALSFISFCMVASSGYVFNDLMDLNYDKIHDTKRFRPIASGQLSFVNALLLCFLSLCIGIVIALHINIITTYLIILYLIITVFYSSLLKKILVMDISVLSLLYCSRLLVGGASTGIQLSVWLIAFSVFFFFSLACVKRFAELVNSKKNGTQKLHGRAYFGSDAYLLSTMALSSGYMAVLVLALYFNSSEVVSLYKTHQYLWPICLLLMYWLSRLVITTNRKEMHDDPIIYASSDLTSYICACIIVICFILATIAH